VYVHNNAIHVPVVIVQYYDVLYFKQNKNTPLHGAAINGYSSVVEVLIRSYADINAVTTVSQFI